MSMNPTVVAALAVGLVVLAAAALAAVYRVARADEAFVRTGLGGPLAILDTGAFVLPVVHRMVPVSLRIMDIKIAVPVCIPGELEATRSIVTRVHTRVNANSADVLRASRSFRGQPVTLEVVSQLISDLLGGAVEAAAAADPEGLADNWQIVATNLDATVVEALAARGMSVELLTLTLEPGSRAASVADSSHGQEPPAS